MGCRESSQWVVYYKNGNREGNHPDEKVYVAEIILKLSIYFEYKNNPLLIEELVYLKSALIDILLFDSGVAQQENISVHIQKL
ncbi:MAG: hypothetical protein Kow00108_24560 [Calditrichia bacterium]